MKNLEQKLGYNFSNRALLNEALRHSSIKRFAIPFERLEFLGDRVLGLVISEHIYRKYPGHEGSMAKMQAAFVCADTCYKIALEIGIDKVISTAGTHLKFNKTVLADAMEAVLGAVFIDSNYESVKKCILTLWNDEMREYDDTLQDPKTTLQELCQKLTGETPSYKLISTKGLAHDPVFTVGVTAMGETAITSGHSRKEAEIIVAREILKRIQDKKAK